MGKIPTLAVMNMSCPCLRHGAMAKAGVRPQCLAGAVILLSSLWRLVWRQSFNEAVGGIETERKIRDKKYE